MTTILVVEDESLIRMAIVDHLEESGFDVVEARDADQALKLLAVRDDIRIIFTDVDMPGSMDGIRLAQAVRDGWPPIRIYVTSGLWRLNSDELPDETVFIPKPYNADELVEQFRAIAH
ncbi:MAG: response regulator [Candidatus Devosia phytovorans]|uniref:Response regulator n=1 Tax=Candidatus Devosia phytovorans TaxID=3121372 RepID=A0AAJ6AZZ5_9HYPH|nr:response regulator [Devosia sp.]WEK03654.1 MAG: response regulator [Devosia sp.]